MPLSVVLRYEPLSAATSAAQRFGVRAVTPSQKGLALLQLLPIATHGIVPPQLPPPLPSE